MELSRKNNPVEAQVYATRKLRLIWKDPVSSRYFQVGSFESLSDETYSFSYIPEAEDVDGFHSLVQFPDLRKTYISEVLPAFFANRVMSPKRPSYEQYLGWLGLGDDAPPIEILARTGGGRVTDTFHLVDSFDLSDGVCEGRFFVSGIRHQDQEISLDSLHIGQELSLQPDPDNFINPLAILLTARGEQVGWVPDWLVDDVHYLREKMAVTVHIEQINKDAPSRLAVLCRLSASKLF